MFAPTDAPRIFALPPGVDFASELAKGVRARLAAAPPEALARLRIAVNTRRAARAVAAAFEDAGATVFLPRIDALESFAAGEAEAPPPVEKLTRRLALTRLMGEVLKARPQLGAKGAAGPLAESLAALLDEFQRERVSLSALDGAAADAAAEAAAHWAAALQALAVARDIWPGFLSDTLKQSDPQARRALEVDGLLARWAAAPPEAPVIGAGSTGSQRLTADVLDAIARLPQGAVVLPGFDFGLDAETWRAVGPDHPQFGFARLLARMEVDPLAVENWRGGRPESGPRAFLLSQALRPAPVTHEWRRLEGDLAAAAGPATEAVDLIEAPHPRAEAAAIAAAMRAGMETGSVALVTPDRTLARRVAAALGRWGLTPDDSAGRPLALTPPGVLLTLIADLLARRYDPVTLLAALKHPMAGGADRRAQRRAVARLEREGLRNRNDATKLNDVSRLLEWMVRDRDGGEAPLVDDTLRPVLEALTPWEAAPRPLVAFVADHRAAAEAVSAGGVWADDDGAAAAAALDRLAAAAEVYGDAAPGDYPEFLAAALNEELPAPAYLGDPRLKIWGTLEARAQSADLVILAGLNEGVWPDAPAIDPWLSRPMRARLGLPAPERRMGLSAHDFQQAASAGRVILSRALKQDGAPTVPSRWLVRMETLMGGLAAPGEEPGAALAAMRARGRGWLAAAEALEAPIAAPREDRPRPSPPADARPRRLNVTEIETLIRDPYSIYARHVLGLDPLEPPRAAPDARERGTVLHDAVERFVRATAARWPDGDEQRRLWAEAVEEALTAAAPPPAEGVLWRRRLERIRDPFLRHEAKRRAEGDPLALEAKGAMQFAVGGAPFTLKGRADRIDRRPDGALAIYDYKAGGAPSKDQVKWFAKQLPLLAAMAEAGVFRDEAGAPIPAAVVAALAYVGLGGDERSGAGKLVDLEPDALDGLVRLLEAYARAETPYLPRAFPEMMSYASDYEHLSRFGEWADRPAGAAPKGGRE